MQAGQSQDVMESEFESRVLARSATVPVVVDFWAAWCQPCRLLGPLLERLAAAAGGAWELAKVDVDMAPALAERYRVQGIPAVKGFRDGQVAAEFVGAQPEAAVRSFLARLLPTRANGLTAEAKALLDRGEAGLAEPLLREALAEDPMHRQAALSLGRLLIEAGRLDEAERRLTDIPAATSEGQSAQALLGRTRFQREAAALPPAAPDDEAALHWSAGLRAAASEDYASALPHFLWLVRQQRRYRDDGSAAPCWRSSPSWARSTS